MNIKPWWQSKTIWLAIIQALVGIFLVFQAQYPAIFGTGMYLMIKSVFDVILRVLTEMPIA